jgi:hypothetical protein
MNSLCGGSGRRWFWLGKMENKSPVKLGSQEEGLHVGSDGRLAVSLC